LFSRKVLTLEPELVTLAMRQASTQADAELPSMSATIEPFGRPADRLPLRVVLGVAVPLAVAALAYGLWWISDRLLYVGPLDRAAFGWFVVIPVWVAAPVVAGFAWQGLTTSMSLRVAALVGATISGAAALLLWQSVAYPNCQFGAIHTAGDWALPSLILGSVIGGGFAISGLITTRTLRIGQTWRAVMLGAGAELAMVGAAMLVTAVLLLEPICQRPHA
jgi:hypothetical protein